MARLEEYWLPNSVKKSLYLEGGKLQKGLPGKRPQAKRPIAKKPPAKKP